ncbi:MAG: alpha/beta fold hydrolase [Nitrosomonadales bacterium]|nr:alpha/beta fold hydrolase [Nitrosomonadales bacterium]
MQQLANSGAALSARHRPSGLNSVFNGGQADFAGYVAETRAMLGKAYADLGLPDAERRIEGNAPFELEPTAGFEKGHGKPYRRGVLLTHGLTDTPYSMRHLAEFFAQSGFRVMAILLPGHGTQPGDLLEVTWLEWAKVVAYGVDRLAEQVDEVYLAGCSTGAALSVRHSLHDPRVRGLFLFSPALRITPLAALAGWHRLYSWLWPSGKWLAILPDLDSHKYESFPNNAAAQIYALTRQLRAQLITRQPDIPVFAAASADDMTVDSAATVGFMAGLRHPSSKLVLYASEPEQGSTAIPAGRVERVNSVFPEQRILSSAHTAMMIPADDGHYGANGAYCNCVHYYPREMGKYRACLSRPEQTWQGEITRRNLRMGLLRRLTYNPNFAGLKISLQRFIESLR